MRLLLDSQVVVWAMAWPERLRPPVREALINSENEIFVSAATFWELRVKQAKGKLVLPEDFEVVLASENCRELPILWRHSRGIPLLPPIHSDPFDRLLVAQAAAEGLVFVTADRNCLRYPVSLLEA